MAFRSESRIVCRRTVLSPILAGVMLLVVLGSACADTEEPSKAQPSGRKRWTHIDLVEHYSFNGPVLEDKDLSGIACVSPTRCLVGADESRMAQVVEMSRSDKALNVLRTVELLNSGDEVDIEAVAVEDDSYYIIGSHGIAKKTGKVQGNRYKIIRLGVDRVTGMPVGGASGLQVASLSNILRADPVLGEHFGKPLQQKGVNVEGLAIRDGRLFVGFRNPNLGGYAYVMEIGADDVFSGTGRPPYVLHKLSLGSGLGIREIVAVQSGFLIIAGNAGSEPSEDYPEAVDYDKKRGFWMFSWDGKGSDVNKIAALPNVPGKAEAMTVLDESEDHVTVLILFDGAKNGQPSVYRIS